MTDRASCLAMLVGLVFPALTPVSLTGCVAEDFASFAVELSSDSAFVGGKCMAWDGEAYAVVWEARTDLLGSIFYARVGPDGTIISEPQVVFDGLEDGIRDCRLLVRGDSYVVLLHESDGDVDDFRFARSGALQQMPTEFLDAIIEFDVAERDGQYAALFTDRIGTPYKIGLKFEGDDVFHTLDEDDNQEFGPILRYLESSDSFVGVWEDDDDIELGAIPPDDPKSYVEVNLIENASGLRAPIAMTESDNGLLWTVWEDDGVPKYQPVGPDGALRWPRPEILAPERRDAFNQVALITVAAGPEADDTIAGDYAVWRSDALTALPQIFAARLDPTPGVGSPRPIPLTDRRFAFRDPFPAASPSGFAVVYEGDIDGTEKVLWTAFPGFPAAP